MKQQDISQQLGAFINQTSGVYTTVPADEVIPSELDQPEPIFEIDHDAVKQKKYEEALVTVGYIMKSVIPRRYHNDEMIQNKMRLDAQQLGMLYYNQMTNDKALQSALDQIAKGDTQPRMYEIIDKLEKRATDISNQITDLQNQLRKYYIDAYLDVQQRENADEMEDEMFGCSDETKKVAKKSVKQIEAKDDEDGVLITSPEELRNKLDAIRIAAAKKKAEDEVNVQEAEVEEI